MMTKRILVVDDEPAVRDMLKDFLTPLEYEVLTAANGEEALILAEREEPEIILLDVRMPGIDGLETCGRLKTQEETRGIPIIMMTGFGVMHDEAHEVGAEDFISKPFNLDDLLMRVSAIGKVRHLTSPHQRLLAYMEELDKSLSQPGE